MLQLSGLLLKDVKDEELLEAYSDLTLCKERIMLQPDSATCLCLWL